MTKSELIQRLAERNPHLYQRDVELIVGAIFDEITAALARGDRVELRGFGAFSVKHRDARLGRNPRTGEGVSVDEKHVPFSNKAPHRACRAVHVEKFQDSRQTRIARCFPDDGCHFAYSKELSNSELGGAATDFPVCLQAVCS